MAGSYHLAAFPSAARTFVADAWHQPMEDGDGLELGLSAAGVGVALVPQLASDPVPDGVRLIRLTTPVHRHIHAARRTTLHGDAGLDRLTLTLRSCATNRLHRT